MMSSLIEWEGSALLTSVFWGMILAGEYDCIRIFRRVVKHHKVWTISVEDIVFWINAGITVFAVTYEINNGIVRGFSIFGFIAGAILFRAAFGRFFVKYGSKAIIFLLKPLKKIARMIKIASRSVGSTVVRIVVRLKGKRR